MKKIVSRIIKVIGVTTEKYIGRKNRIKIEYLNSGCKDY